MGLFSKINDIIVFKKLCGKTWDLLESTYQISFVFEHNNELHRLINGESAIGRFVFVPNSRSLIIYDNDQRGTSYYLRFVCENVLILNNEETGDDLCFCNRSSNNKPISKAEAYKIYFEKHIDYIRRFSREEMTDIVDDVAEGLRDDDKILLVDTLRKFVPKFNTRYIYYLGCYCKNHDPDFNEAETYERLRMHFSSAHESETMNIYINKTFDNIKKYTKK